MSLDATRMQVAAAPRADAARWLAALCWIASGALLAGYVALLLRFVVDWPLHDDLTQILAVPGYLAQLDWPGKLSLLFSPSPEHRIVTLRLAGWLGGALPGGLDFAALIALGNAMLLAAAACLVVRYTAPMRAAGALLAALLLTSPTHYGAQYWATGSLQHFGVSFYALAALASLAGTPRHGIAVLLAFAAAFTSANGLVVIPAAVALLALGGRRNEAIAWALGGAIVIALYFVGYTAAGGSSESMLREPIALAAFALATLGGIGHTFSMSLAIGATIAVAWIALIVAGAWRRVPPVIVASALFFMLSCAMIGIGRANLGIDAVAIPRYRVYSALALLASVAALAWVVRATIAGAVLVGAIAVAGVLHALAWPVFVPQVVELAMSQRALRDHYAADGHGRYEGYTQEFGDFTLMRAGHLGVYRGARKATPPTPLTAVARPANAPSEPMQVQVHAGDRTLSVSGWIAGRRESLDLWLADDARAFRGRLATVAFPLASMSGQRTGFHGTTTLAGVPPGHYRLGYGGDAVAWSLHEIEVR